MYRCCLCGKFCLKSNKGYMIEAVNGDKEIVKKRICDSCGDQINANYDRDKQLLDLEPMDDQETTGEEEGIEDINNDK